MTKDTHVDDAEITAPPLTSDGPMPGWLVGMLWTLTAWALYYYIVVV